MIKEKTIKIKVYSTKYYDKSLNIKKGEINEIGVNNLPKGSHVKITAICDICGNEKETMYKSYIKMTQDDGLYYCVKCRKIKTKNSNLEKYGVENVMQLENVKNKMYETNLEKYGHMCSAQSEEIKEKSKNTCFEKYGVDNYLKTDEMREKVKNTCLEKYGVENPMQCKEIRNKQIKTMLSKYGVENISKLYINNNIDEFINYSLNVKKYTKNNKNKLFNDWDGHDYYDDEYIKEYMSLDYKDRNYPTIDHKISVYYGFNNGIPEKELANINNLCITKRYINSSKGKKTSYEFLKKDNKEMEKYVKIMCVLDRSTSMSSIIDDAINGFNTFLSKQKEIEGNATMDILLFDSSFETVCENIDIQNVSKFNSETYVPQGCTALYDAIGMTIDNEIDRLATLPLEERPEKSLCVIW